MFWFPQDILVDAQAKGPLNAPAYLQAREKVRRLAGPQALMSRWRMTTSMRWWRQPLARPL